MAARAGRRTVVHRATESSAVTVAAGITHVASFQVHAMQSLGHILEAAAKDGGVGAAETQQLMQMLKKGAWE